MAVQAACPVLVERTDATHTVCKSTHTPNEGEGAGIIRTQKREKVLRNKSSRKSEGNITDQSCSHSNQDPVLTTAASIFTFGSRTLTAGTATSNFTGAFPALDLELLRPTRPGGSAKERVDAGGYVGLSRLKMEGVVGLSGTCLLGVGRKKKSYQRGEGSILRRSLSVPRPRFPRAPRPPQLPRVPQPRVPRAPPFPDSPSPSSRGADFSPFLYSGKEKKEERGERGQRRA